MRWRHLRHRRHLPELLLLLLLLLLHQRHLMRLRLRVLLHDALHLRRRDVRRKPRKERGVRVHLVRQRTEMRVQLCETRYENNE